MMPPDLLRLVPAHRFIVSQIREIFPDESDDDLADTVAGESDLPDAVVATLRLALEREAHGKAIADLIETLTGRKRRLEDGAKSLRLIALQAMLIAALPSIKAADMSVSVGRGKPKVLITEPDIIPDHLCRIIREPSKSAIAIELAAGREVAGASFGNPVQFLSVHRS
jgi:Gp157 protein